MSRLIMWLLLHPKELRKRTYQEQPGTVAAVVARSINEELAVQTQGGEEEDEQHDLHDDSLANSHDSPPPQPVVMAVQDEEEQQQQWPFSILWKGNRRNSC